MIAKCCRVWAKNNPLFSHVLRSHKKMLLNCQLSYDWYKKIAIENVLDSALIFLKLFTRFFRGVKKHFMVPNLMKYLWFCSVWLESCWSFAHMLRLYIMIDGNIVHFLKSIKLDCNASTFTPETYQRLCPDIWKMPARFFRRVKLQAKVRNLAFKKQSFCKNEKSRSRKFHVQTKQVSSLRKVLWRKVLENFGTQIAEKK